MPRNNLVFICHNPVADLRGRLRRDPLLAKIFSISCSFSEILAKSYMPPPAGLAPTPTGNPGSAPAIRAIVGVIKFYYFWKLCQIS